MSDSRNTSQLTLTQEWGLIILRIIIGWHFLYEGIVKLMSPEGPRKVTWPIPVVSYQSSERTEALDAFAFHSEETKTSAFCS